MSRFAVSVKEILKRTVIVEASDLEEALCKVEAAVDRDEILLDADDFDEREIIPSEYWSNGEVPEGIDVSYYYHLEEPGQTEDSKFKELGIEGHRTVEWVKSHLRESSVIEENVCPKCGGILVTDYGFEIQRTSCVDCGYSDFDYE